MKGVILAGGAGTRLSPLTKVTNKHLLPVGDKPMIFYPIEKMVEAGIQEVLLVTGGEDAGDFLKLLGDGREFGLKSLYYAYQRGHGGIAAALALAEDFVGASTVCVILGDNIFSDKLAYAFYDYCLGGAHLFFKEVPDLQRFGVPVFKAPWKELARIEEKPKKPKSSYAVTGIYLYDSTVFMRIRKLKPSRRGELEITDVNNSYIKEGKCGYTILKGSWSDAGTFESLRRASELVRGKE